MKAKHELKRLDVVPRKERGQNFVIDSNVIRTIAAFGAPVAGEELIEIGPGLGALTAELSSHGPLTVIEIESNFCEEIRRRFPAVKVIHSDARKVDISTLGSNLTVFGNLPYVFSTDIIFHMLKYRSSIKRAIFLLQREFTERVAAPPGGRSYGILSVMTQIACIPRLGPIIPGNSFHPPTKVESRLLEMRMRDSCLIPDVELPWFTKVVRAAFLKKRKMLHNSLKASGLFSGEMVEEALRSTGIVSSRRAETLSIDELHALARALREKT